MKIFVKTLKGTHFEIDVDPKITVSISFSVLRFLFIPFKLLDVVCGVEN